MVGDSMNPVVAINAGPEARNKKKRRQTYDAAETYFLRWATRHFCTQLAKKAGVVKGTLFFTSNEGRALSYPYEQSLFDGARFSSLPNGFDAQQGIRAGALQDRVLMAPSCPYHQARTCYRTQCCDSEANQSKRVFISQVDLSRNTLRQPQIE